MMSENRANVAIIGPGNIGTDLLSLLSDHLIFEII